MQTPENNFWDWFKKFTKTFSFDSKGYMIYTDDTESQLEEAVNKYDEDLGIIIGSQNFFIELIITAYGDKSKFDKVNSLVKAASHFDNIKVIALKPPTEDPFFTTSFKGEKINSREVYFDVSENRKYPKKIGIKIFFQRKDLEKEKFSEIALIMCENIVGERRQSEYVDIIDVEEMDRHKLDDYIPLTRLKSYLDWHIDKYVGS
jgi:hypothetical protein